MKEKLDKKELVNHLRNQLDEISDFVTIYDSGKKTIAQDIAVKLRVIFHSTNNSKSLIKQLRLDHVSFVDTGKKYESKNLFNSHWGLIAAQTTLGQGGDGSWKYVPMLDKSAIRLVDFQNWWDSKKVIVDKDKNIFTRRKLVLELADTDGGAHVDEALKADYHNLTRKNSLGWFQVDQWGKSEALENPVPPSIRQIAFETLETFKSVDIENESKLR
ncbi:MAG: hypothetical protein J0L67_19955 [Cytophagales bacterium]|nr:hypothetical protein [Cytophagales bacterium]